MHTNGEEIRIVLKYTADRPKGNSTRNHQTETIFDIEDAKSKIVKVLWIPNKSGTSKVKKFILTVPIKTET